MNTKNNKYKQIYYISIYNYFLTKKKPTNIGCFNCNINCSGF